MKKYIKQVIYYIGLLAFLFSLNVWLPLFEGDAKKGPWVNEELRKLKSEKDQGHLNPGDTEVQLIFEAGKNIQKETVKSLGSITLFITGAVLFLVGVLYKPTTYIDIFVFNIPSYILFTLGSIEALVFLVAVGLSFSGVYIKRNVISKRNNAYQP